MSKERFVSIDYLKAIAIFLVVVGHFLPGGSILRNSIYLVHIPIFFIIAGFLFSERQTWKDTILKLSKRIILPYMVTYFFSAALQAVMGGGLDSQTFLDFFYFRGKIDLWNSVLWFFPVYFCVTLLFKILRQLFGNKLVLPLAVIAVVLIFYFNSPALELFGINKILLATLYHAIGFFARKKYIRTQKISLFGRIFTGILCVFIMAVFGIVMRGTVISINQNVLGIPIVYIIASSTACLLALASLSHAPYSSVMQFISSHTMFIMCTHLTFRLVLSRILQQDSLIYIISGVPVFIAELAGIQLLLKARSFLSKSSQS